MEREQHQLDFFIDGRDALLVHAVVTRLVARDPDGADVGPALLRHEHPAHPDLPALMLLTEALQPLPTSPASHATLTASIETMDRTLVPAARRLMGTDAAIFLQPLWQTLAAASASLTCSRGRALIASGRARRAGLDIRRDLRTLGAPFARRRGRGEVEGGRGVWIASSRRPPEGTEWRY